MRLVIIALAVMLSQFAAPAAAQSPTGNAGGVITGEEVLAGVISEIERRIIGRYYRGDRYGDYEEAHRKTKKKKAGKGMPQGLAKRAQLPPGLEMQLDERGALPPGLARRDLPRDLLGALPRRIGEHYLIVDDDVLLVERATGVVLDVLENIVQGPRAEN